MTYREYVTGFIEKFGLSTANIEFILFEADLDPDATITNSDQKVLIKTAMYHHIPVLMAGLQNVSEGGYSVSWSIEGLKLWYALLAKELGLDDLLNTGQPKVRDASSRW